MSKGMLSSPSKPITDEATKIFGINPITITLNDLNIKKSIKEITAKTIIKDPI